VSPRSVVAHFVCAFEPCMGRSKPHEDSVYLISPERFV
jgi:hypothetical protein